MTEAELDWLKAEFVRCAPWLLAALEEDAARTHELIDVWRAIEDGKAQFWPDVHSAIVTVLEFFPRKTVLRYWLAGGDTTKGVLVLEECKKATVGIEQWAKEAGASLSAISGRPGWIRALPGYREAGRYAIKDISLNEQPKSA